MAQRAHPEALGFDTERLERIPAFLRRYVDDGRLAGWQVVVARGGRVALEAVHGDRDVERGTPVTEDTLWRIYSMTKPITSVALMTLYEHGAFQLDDPVGRFLPELAELSVYAGGEGAAMETVAAERAVTIRDLLTHTAGFTYGFMQAHPVDALYRQRDIGGVQSSGTLADMVTRLGETPLQFQPGTRWNYSVATDVLGRLIEVIAGEDLDDFLTRTILEPLGMIDTGFSVPAGAEDRLGSCYERTPDGFRLQDDAETSGYRQRPDFLSGGGGLVSTAADYLRFCRMILGGGELDGVRILGPRTLDLMRRNHLPTGGDLTSMGQPVFSETRYDGIGFGLGWSVVLDPARAQVSGNPGELAWGGMASTAFWIDPADDLAVIFMTQLIPSSAYPIRRYLRSLVYQALVD
jgi:CubicO group peptidase (beta-lactamase class C family)